MVVLVIDDEEVFRTLLKVVLQLDGHEPYLAENGEEGFKMAIKYQPDIILLDAMMPGIDGFRTCKLIKENQRTKHIPVLMLTAMDKVGDVEIAFDAGADEYITKPINEATFNETLLRKYKSVKNKI